MNLIIPDKKGTVFVTVLVLAMLMVFIIVSVSNMILQDTHIVHHIRYSTQAQYIAEGGISDALADLANEGFDDFSSISNVALGGGRYSVSLTEAEINDETRWLLTSTGEVNNVSRVVVMEVRDVSSPTMDQALSAGNNITLKANQGNITILGNVHANNDLLLKEQGDATLLQIQAYDESTGKATSSNRYTIQGDGVTVADATNSGGGKPRLSMPIFDFAYFKKVAQYQGGTYYAASQTFDSDMNISGGTAGIIYVDGYAVFSGKCKITGGFVAKGDITINAGDELTQKHDNNNRFPIFMSEAGARIKMYGKFTTDEGNILYATNDIQVETPSGKSTVVGTVIAGGSFSITANNDLTITYDRITSPESTPQIVKIVSWNR